MGGLARWVRAMGRLADGLAELSALAVVALTAMVTFGVVMRYVFNAALTWADEVSSYCLLAIVFFGLAHTLNTGNHIRIDFFTRRLPARRREWVNLAAYAVGLAFTALFIAACWARWQNFWVRGTISFTDLHTPLYLPASMLLVGSAALFLTMLGRAIEHLFEVFATRATLPRPGPQAPPERGPRP